MTGFPKRPIAFLMASLFWPGCAVLAAQDASVEGATRLVADRIAGQSDRSTRAEGAVEAHKADVSVFSDRATYFHLEDEIEAEGHVRLVKPDTEIKGPYLRLKLAAQLGYFDDAVYKITRTIVVKDSDDAPTLSLMEPLPALPPRQSMGYGMARRIHFEGENQYRIDEGSYSTCRPEERDWYTEGKEIALDYDLNQGEAKDAVVYFKDTPILYWPYLSFPLNRARKSGLLAPTFSSSTRTGFDLSIPYYWNVAPNYDLTLTPRVMTRRGLQLGAEARYTDWWANGEYQVELMQRDREFDDRRYAYGLKHWQTLGKGFSAYVDWNAVSDDEYFSDLSSSVVETSQRQLPRQFDLYYNSGSWWSASLQTLRYQTLNPSDETLILQPYAMAPRLNFEARLPEWKGLDLQFTGQYTRFTHDELEQGGRTVLYPQLTYHHIRPGYYIRPKIGLHSTTYKLSQRASGLSESLSRNLPVFSLDMGMTFERELRLGSTDWLQTLEPQLYYLNIPHKKQDEFPLFDTGLADFNFAQIFSENRFNGHDRINNANQVTAALTSRLIDSKTGAERARVMIGQRYYFTSLKIGLPGEEMKEDRYSAFLGAFSGQVAPHTYVDAAMEYDFNDAMTSRFTLGARYQPTHGQVFSVAYRYNRAPETNNYYYRDTMDQVDISGQWNLTGRWQLVGRYNYAFDSSRLVEGIAGVEYNAGCWVARFVVQRLETTADDPNTSTFFQLEFNDFGQVGSNPIQMLRRSIPGYRKINDLPSGSF